MNAITILKSDHRKVLNLLQQISSTTARASKKRAKLLNEIVSALEMHTKIEEKIFYPTLIEFPKAKEKILEAYEEHYYIDIMIADLKRVNYDDEKWKAKFAVLKENVSHHIKEEETRLFPLAQKLLGALDLKLLGKEMQQLRENLSDGIFTSVVSSLVTTPPYFTGDKIPDQKKRTSLQVKSTKKSKTKRKK